MTVCCPKFVLCNALETQRALLRMLLTDNLLPFGIIHLYLAYIPVEMKLPSGDQVVFINTARTFL